MAIQHLLPQDISNYRFRLIGDMTIKQFASLAICIVLAIITYSMPLPFFFKYPLVFTFIVLGVGMAFVPVQGRSLDIWIIAFIKSIYSPTQYTWKSTPATAETIDTATPNTPSTNEVVRQVSNPSMEITQGITEKVQPSSPYTEQKQTTPTSTVVEPTQSTPAVSQAPVQIQTNTTPVSTPPVSTPTTTPVQTAPVQPVLNVTPTPIQVNPSSNNPFPEKPAIAPQPQNTLTQTPPTVNLPIPFTPSSPNTLVGLTLTPSGHILDSVMVEIKRNNLTLRATKSNKLGQFMFARPLESGTYQILAEKEGNTFSPYSLELTGNIVKPLKIQAQ